MWIKAKEVLINTNNCSSIDLYEDTITFISNIDYNVELTFLSEEDAGLVYEEIFTRIKHDEKYMYIIDARLM